MRADDLVRQARTGIDVCMSGGVEELVDLHFLPRGTPVRILYPDDVDHTAVPAFLQGDDQVRVTFGLSAGVVLCDGTAVVPGPTPVVITSPETVALLTAWFEHMWKGSAALHPPATEGLSQQERKILRLLASGATDEATAARLGTSARSVRRVVAGVMCRLGARSRFQAGRLAAHRGWL